MTPTVNGQQPFLRLKGRSRTRVWVSVIVVLLASSAIWKYLQRTTAHQSNEIRWPLDRDGSEWILLRLPGGYGHANRIAETVDRALYPDRGPGAGGEVHKDMLLSALWPGLVPENRENHHEFNQPGGGRQMLALLQSGAVDGGSPTHQNALQTAFDVAVDFSTNHLCVAPMALASAAKDGKPKCYERKAPDAKPAKYGLDRLGVDFSKYPDIPEATRDGIFFRDIYYARDASGNLKTVILCTAEEKKTSDDGPQYRTVPQCEHKFISPSLKALVSIGYRRVYLAEWRAVELSWNQLLESLVATKKVNTTITKYGFDHGE
jgi:hypothetical protein